MSLVAYFKANPLVTHVGEFAFNRQLGQSGNSVVMSFSKGSSRYAVKFIENKDTRKLARFVDEFFCAAQIGTHQNVVQKYHLEVVEIEGAPYSIIIMKEYESSLHENKTIALLSEAEKCEKGRKLLNDLLSGLDHLHRNGVIHRDIKPQNIFFDAASQSFAIGDLGIAHFSDAFNKEAVTRVGERLSNYLFSAPEQYDPKVSPAPNWDIYALGQVLSWYLFDQTIRGDGRESYSGSNKEFSILDKIIHRCVQNDPAKRFQSIDEIRDFERSIRDSKRDIFERLYDFDEVIRGSIPKIRDIYETENTKEITRFLKNLDEKCQHEEFWWIDADAGDNTLLPIKQIEEDRWLFQNHYEVKISKLICYRSNSLWSNFLILLFEPDNLFNLVDFDGHPVKHPDASEWETDYAVLFRNAYMRSEEFENGHYEHNGEVFKTPSGEAEPRYRYLKPYAYLIVPRGAGPDRIDREVNKQFIQTVMESRSLDLSLARKFLYEASKHTSQEITRML